MHALHQGVRERAGPRDLGPDQPRHAYRCGYSRRAPIGKTDCVACGQCITHCPTGALRERDDTETVFDALANPDKIVLVQMRACRAQRLGRELGISREEATVERLACALRRVGFEYVFDTDFSADLTIMEEGSSCSSA
ncbi:MAG: [Fe-Fe] hydrogenase large subunit C-terminal domain-containing protein [Collinsella sp.]